MKKDKGNSGQMMAFTFFFAVAFYLLFLGYNYWQGRSADDKI